MNSIPVLGVPIVNGVRWLDRLIKSIDYPVDNLVVINNNGRGHITSELEELRNNKPSAVKTLHIVHLPGNIGVAGAWNLIIKSFITAPYWIISNHDIEFGPGLLRFMHEGIQADDTVDLAHASPGEFGDGSFECFAITEKGVQRFGLFDENIYPAYGEDVDLLMKSAADWIHRGIPTRKVINTEHTYRHGPGSPEDYLESGMQTGREEEGLYDRLEQVNFINWEYLTEKWGPDWRGTSPNYAYPFGNDSNSLTVSTYDLGFNRKKHLGF
jgi:hypothetical protein